MKYIKILKVPQSKKLTWLGTFEKSHEKMQDLCCMLAACVYTGSCFGRRQGGAHAPRWDSLAVSLLLGLVP